MKIYMVVDCLNAPGKVYAIFADEDSAQDFCDHYHANETRQATVVERSLLYGQHVTAHTHGYIE